MVLHSLSSAMKRMPSAKNFAKTGYEKSYVRRCGIARRGIFDKWVSDIQLAGRSLAYSSKKADLWT